MNAGWAESAVAPQQALLDGAEREFPPPRRSRGRGLGFRLACALVGAAIVGLFCLPDRRQVVAPTAGDVSTPTSAFVFAATDKGAYSRMFGPQLGVAEDPATGSATGPLALFMIRYGLAQGGDGARFVSEQGTQMGRQSFLHIQVHGEKGAGGIEVGGHVAELANAVMRIPVPATV